MMTTDERALLQETRDSVIEMKTVLLGPNGVETRLTTVEKEQGKEKTFRTRVMVLVSLVLLFVEPALYYCIDLFRTGGNGGGK